MSRLVSIGVMVKQLAGMVGTDDLSPWENEFVRSVVHNSGDGDHTQSLSEKQVDIVTRIYGKHFA